MPTMFHPDHPWFVHQFQTPDRQIHTVITMRRNLRRKPNQMATCATPIEGAIPIVPHDDPTRSVPTSCDRCIDSFNGFVSLADRAGIA
jgi:hypothetical protein